MPKINNLVKYKSIPILSIAKRLGIKLHGKKAMCFSGHDKNTPSLSFVPEKNIWKCFGCNKKGDSIKLVMEVLKCDFLSAISWISQEFSVYPDNSIFSNYYSSATKEKIVPTKEVDKKALITNTFMPNPEIYKWFIDHCNSVSKKQGIDYLRSHNISLDLEKKYNIKELSHPLYAYKKLVDKWGNEKVYNCGMLAGTINSNFLIWKNYSIIFPFYTSNEVKYIQARQFDRQTKYLNLKGIKTPLFNFDIINSLKQGDSVFFCEGVPDAISLSSLGVAAIGVLGASSFTSDLAKHFLFFKIYVVPDGDNGGEVFKKSIEEIFNSYGKTVYSFKMKDKYDVSDYLSRKKKYD